MLYEYEIIGKKQINSNKDYINFDKKELIIKSVIIPTCYNYCTFLKKLDSFYKESLYVCLSNSRLTENTIKFRHTTFGYVIINIDSIFKELYIRENSSVKVIKTEENEDNIIFKLDIN